MKNSLQNSQPERIALSFEILLLLLHSDVKFASMKISGKFSLKIHGISVKVAQVQITLL